MERRKKVLFVVTKSNFGGAQRYVFDLATHLPRERFEIAVACGGDAEGKIGRLSYLLNEKHIPTIEVPALTRDVHARNDWRAFFALVGLLREEKPDIVHLNSSKAAGLGALAARLVGIRCIIFTVHGLPFDEDRPWYERWLIASATWCTALLAHRTITLSSDAFARIRQLPFLYRTTTLIFNGIEPPEFLAPRTARAELRSIDPSIPDGFLVGSIGELHRNKGYELALDALTYTDAHLILVGEGEERENLRTYAERRGIAARVHFLGFVADAAKYIRAFDAFLLTSRKEGLPYVLLEAGAAHVPIVAVDIPSVRDIILPDFTGLLVPRDPPVIARALERLTDSTLVRSLTEELATRVRSTFSLLTMVEKTRALYDEPA